MIITELIKELENFKEKNGDLPVHTFDTDCPWDRKITSLKLMRGNFCAKNENEKKLFLS